MPSHRIAVVMRVCDAIHKARGIFAVAEDVKESRTAYQKGKWVRVQWPVPSWHIARDCPEATGKALWCNPITPHRAEIQPAYQVIARILADAESFSNWCPECLPLKDIR